MPKLNNDKSGALKVRREKRQAEAEQRKKEAAGRTPEEQLDRLRERGVTSGREWDRLQGVIRADIVERGTKALQKKTDKASGRI